MKVWKGPFHERIKIFLWRLLANVLPTMELLSALLGSNDNKCVLCLEEEESTIH